MVRGYLRITDRTKDLYIYSGFNCCPAEIESLMFASGWFAAHRRNKRAFEVR